MMSVTLETGQAWCKRWLSANARTHLVFANVALCQGLRQGIGDTKAADTWRQHFVLRVSRQ